MIRPRRCTALLLLLVLVGCRVERRPPTDDGSGTDADTAGLEDATAFLDRLQEARRAGRTTFLRDRLHPDAVLVPGEGSLPGASETPPPDALDRLVTPAADVDGWEAVEAEAGAGAAAFVLRYPRSAPGARRPVETLVLVPDSAGWRIRLLVRAFAGPDPPEP